MARKVTYDEQKVKELRMKVILASLDVMDDKDISKWSQYKKDLVLKYASRVLPVLYAGRNDDSDLIPQLLISEVVARKNGINTSPEQNSGKH